MLLPRFARHPANKKNPAAGFRPAHLPPLPGRRLFCRSRGNGNAEYWSVVFPVFGACPKCVLYRFIERKNGKSGGIKMKRLQAWHLISTFLFCASRSFKYFNRLASHPDVRLSPRGFRIDPTWGDIRTLRRLCASPHIFRGASFAGGCHSHESCRISAARISLLPSAIP